MWLIGTRSTAHAVSQGKVKKSGLSLRVCSSTHDSWPNIVKVSGLSEQLPWAPATTAIRGTNEDIYLLIFSVVYSITGHELLMRRGGWVGAINLERNGLFARFTIHQHLRVGGNIAQLQHEYQQSVLRLKSWQVSVENQDRLLDDLSCLACSGTGWIGALAQPATCVIVVQITVNTSAPPGNEGLRARCPRNIPARCREQRKGRGRCDRNACRAGRWGRTPTQSWFNMGKQWSLLAPASWANI